MNTVYEWQQVTYMKLTALRLNLNKLALVIIPIPEENNPVVHYDIELLDGTTDNTLATIGEHNRPTSLYMAKNLAYELAREFLTDEKHSVDAAEIAEYHRRRQNGGQ